MSEIDWESVSVLYDIEPINNGYHYRLFEKDGELLFARRWEVYEFDVGEHQPRDCDEWEITRDSEAIEEFVER